MWNTNGGIFKIAIFYLVETRRKKVTLSREHIVYRWLTYQKATTQLTFRNSKQVLMKAKGAIEGERN